MKIKLHIQKGLHFNRYLHFNRLNLVAMKIKLHGIQQGLHFNRYGLHKH